MDVAGAKAASQAGARSTGDPSARWLRGRALEMAGRRSEGEPLVADPADVLSSYGPWWAMRGRWARSRGDEGRALHSFVEAIAADPFYPESACEAVELSASPAGASGVPLCAAARAYASPPFDSD